MTLLEYIIANSFDGDNDGKEKLIKYCNRTLDDSYKARNLSIFINYINVRFTKDLLYKLSQVMVRVMKEDLSDSFHKAINNFYSEKEDGWMKSIFSKKANCNFEYLRIIAESFRWMTSNEGHEFWLRLEMQIEKHFMELLKTKI